MSPDAVKEMIRIDDERRQRFHEKLTQLRSVAKVQAAIQRKSRIDKKGKSRRLSIYITVLLRLMRRIKGMPLTYQPTYTCRDKRCKHVTVYPTREIHALPQDERGKEYAKRTEIAIVGNLSLWEFLT